VRRSLTSTRDHGVDVSMHLIDPLRRAMRTPCARRAESLFNAQLVEFAVRASGQLGEADAFAGDLVEDLDPARLRRGAEGARPA
jgi:hypothetical protein